MEIEKHTREGEKGWEWVWSPLLETALEGVPNPLFAYKRTLNSVSILYTKIFNLNTSVYDFNTSELIVYVHMVGMSKIKTQERRNKSCTVCVICHNAFYGVFHYFSTNARLYDVCDRCKTSQNTADFYINTESGDGDIFEDLIENKLDIGLKINNKIYYLYHSTFKIVKFNYKTILFEPWYHQAVKEMKNGVLLCKLCKNNKRHINSTCLKCLNYSYKISFEFVIKDWLALNSIIDSLDITCVIFSRLLKLLGYSVNKSQIYSYYQPKHVIVKTSVIESFNDTNLPNLFDILLTDKDLISEHTLHKYIDHDYNLSISDEDVLCDLAHDVSDEDGSCDLAYYDED